MTNQTKAWVAAAKPAADYQGTSSTFSIASLEFSRERSYDRTLLRLTARGTRTFDHGGFELLNVHALLLDADGAPIARRSHESSRQTLLGPLTIWAHELYDDQLAAAAALIYEVETRVDVRRVLLAGTLATIDLDTEDRRPWPLTITSQADDALVRFTVRTGFNRGEFEIGFAAESTDLHDGHRHDLELDLCDDSGAVVATRSTSISLTPAGVAFGDTSMRLEKKVARAVRSLVIRGRSEVRAVARIGPFTIPT